MKMSRGFAFLKGEKTFLAISMALIFASLFLNLLGVGYSQDWFFSYQKDSSFIIEKAAQCKESYDGGPLTPTKSGRKATEPSCSGAQLEPYYSQFGLQARVFSIFAPGNDDQIAKYFNYVQAGVALLTALVLVLFIWRVRRIFGPGVGYVTLVLISISVWIVAFGRNVYWVPFTLFAPFVLSFIAYEWLKARKKMVFFYAIVGLLLFIKFLNGYEYASTLIVSTFVPVVFYEMYRHKVVKLTLLWRQALLLLGVGFVALVAAIAVNTIAVNSYTHSMSESFGKVIGRAEERAGGKGLAWVQPYAVYGFEGANPEIYKSIDRYYDLDVLKDGSANPVKYVAIVFLSYAFLPVISVPVMLAQPIGSVLQSFIVAVVAIYACLCVIKKRPGGSVLYRALFWSFTVALIGSLSWLVLMPAHTYPHAHINGIVYFLPTLLIGYVIIGYVLTDKPRERLSK